MGDGLIRAWYYHVLIGHLRVGPTAGRNFTVQPLAPPRAHPGLVAQSPSVLELIAEEIITERAQEDPLLSFLLRH
jgi:hypothetical protein